MSTLVDHVAKAIAADEQAGGAKILRPDEVSALEEASILLRRAGDPHSADVILNLIHEIGPNVMFIDGPGLPRVDEYHRHFAHVAIASYDDWMDIRFTQQRTANRAMDKLADPLPHDVKE